MRCVTRILKQKFAFLINLFNFPFASSTFSHSLVPMLVEVIPVSQDSDQFQCSILKIGNLRILLDCGWTESLDTEQYAALSPEVFSGIDAVLISHYSLGHCGALPYLLNRGMRKKFLQDAPPCRVLATEACRRMGELTLASLHEDIDKVKDVTVSDGSYAFSIEDIVTSFSAIQALQFNEVVHLGPGISLSAQPSGRLIGGAYWIITAGSQRIVYSVDYCLTAGRAVGGLSVGPATKATVLITDGSKIITATDDSSMRISATSSSLAEDTLVNSIKSCLRSGGTALLPVDPNGRVLELLLAIESAFAGDASLQVYPVVFLSPLGDVVLDQVKTRMEWMNKAVLNDFENSVNFTAHPFLLNHIKLCSSIQEFNEQYPLRKPKVVLATSASLDYGDSRELLSRFSSDPSNVVLFTQLCGLPSASLAARIIKDATAQQPGELVYKESQFIKTPYPDEQLRQIYRESLEKEAMEDEIRRRRQRERTQAATAAAPSSAAALPVDLIRTGHQYDEGAEENGFFRPQLFVAQTVAASTVMRNQRAVTSDYGEQIHNLEVDTWRAHAEMSELGASREATAMAASGGVRVKGERGVKGEQDMMIKGDIDDEFRGNRVKGELLTAGSAESFDWRRDMQVRFGEPMRVETRERIFKIACKVKIINGLEGHASAAHRREFVSSVHPLHLVTLPTRNAHDLQLMSMIYDCHPCQENGAQLIDDDEILLIPVSLEISGEKKWLNIDVSARSSLETKTLSGSNIRVAKLTEETTLLGPMEQVPELIQVPSGEFIDFVVTGNDSAKRQRRSESSLLLGTEPFRLADFAKILRTKFPDAIVQFVNTESGRVLSFKSDSVEVLVTSAKQNESDDCPVVSILGTPSECFYKVRRTLYETKTCL